MYEYFWSAASRIKIRIYRTKRNGHFIPLVNLTLKAVYIELGFDEI
ncbi:hypothetical protein AYM02_01700 [Coxiella burnetii]|uniref:Uncharacterized protein n=2 Tax=Coxiella burnetii TaxID=777 RepID=Q83A49_COXBU|nr:hypothetical protein [Coxiella burnetii]NP_821032.1 hypothetical protein CBU_2061 [Coxiella burnetii RSA 493]ACI23238.1 hypothetical protein CBUD_2154a [Coxiella burnetii Dugway 5J108-111]ACJ21197.1 hypothetical protein CbuK_2106 [Coxiella burnetii CbuK_Q154]APQ67142.1 hypothetical protein A35_10705 [Coxiella burnetii 'MSU Goat Q177']ATN86748.1 hypothetical protein AYO29_10265 [Coxiella burnetii str. Schperling]AAO91546.1 hypothetical protein CBU_2061 [Coxiella burnetii RSA 493]